MPTWKELIARNPQHSENYAQRWRRLQEQGHDIHGEARLIDALAERNSTILDAGCGTGRVAGYLSEQGHNVVGTDVDPVLIGYARDDFPRARFVVGDLCRDAIPDGPYDLAVSAGNVVGFIPVDDIPLALGHVHAALHAGGRWIVGFGAGRGLEFEQFLQMAREAGFTVENTFESWDLKPFTQDSTFLVAFLRK
ncbi:class I SAM-dependent methyltransferase [Corynebacterium tapiri]|uniref:Class I SAM-dependent methyltransferase n=1 Tax=Corynebacterium tapiri TaxID=1448266 RepID=A0A5C4U3F9_9CORY|nr:class I SAM-dependent methyltransferase [Corynebacterium tapiri]TNL97634.1 class I SAM-dependent methyltransferase [Corynebacterium tapiri]